MACSGHVSSLGAGAFIVVDSLEGLLPMGDVAVYLSVEEKKYGSPLGLSIVEPSPQAYWRRRHSAV